MQTATLDTPTTAEDLSLFMAAYDCSATIKVRERVNQDENPVCRDWRRA